MTISIEETVEAEALAGRFLLTRHLGVDIYVDTDSGVFSATFSQGAGNKRFERTSLTELRHLITQHVYPFTGHVEVASRPRNLIDGHDIDQLQEKLQPSGRYTFGRIYKQQPVEVFTGVDKASRDGTEVHFRKADGKTERYQDNESVRPNPTLDAQFYALAQQYFENQRDWRAAFQVIIDQYQPLTIQQIVDELRQQGARTGRA